MGVPTAEESTAHVGVLLGNAVTMGQLHERLKAQRILVPYVPSYSGTGPEGLMRIALCSEHTLEMIDQLLAALNAHFLPS